MIKIIKDFFAYLAKLERYLWLVQTYQIDHLPDDVVYDAIHNGPKKEIKEP